MLAEEDRGGAKSAVNRSGSATAPEPARAPHGAGERRRRSRGGARVPPRRARRGEDDDGLRRGARGVRRGEEGRIVFFFFRRRFVFRPVPVPILEPRRRRRRAFPAGDERYPVVVVVVGRSRRVRRPRVRRVRGAATRTSGYARLRPRGVDDVLGRVPQRVRRSARVPRRRRRREEGPRRRLRRRRIRRRRPRALDEHVLESLKTMFCASHEGTQSQASVILYPAPRNAKTCGSHEVAVPLGRYTAREWFDKIDELREDDESCCGFRHTEPGDSPLGDSPGAPARLPTGSAPLAEALDAAAAELDARGAHAPSNALVVVVAAAVPSPVVKSESCSEDAPREVLLDDPRLALRKVQVPRRRRRRGRHRVHLPLAPRPKRRAKAPGDGRENRGRSPRGSRRGRARVGERGAGRAPRGRARGPALATPTGFAPSARSTAANWAGGSTAVRVTTVRVATVRVAATISPKILPSTSCTTRGSLRRARR